MRTVRAALMSMAEMMDGKRRLLHGAVIIAVLASLLIIRWGYNYHRAMREEIEAKEGLYLAASSIARRAAEMENLKLERAARLAGLEKGLLKAERPAIAAAELQEAFKALASKRGVTITSERALPVSDKDYRRPYIRIPVEFQLSAGLSELKGLLYDLQASPAIIGVKELRVKTAEQKGPGRLPGRLDVQMVIEGAVRGAGA